MEWIKNIKQFEPFAVPAQRLEEKKNILRQQPPLPGLALQRIKNDLFLEWTYHSNSIEGNTLNLNETRMVLEEGITIKGKTLREHLEITNHHQALHYLETLVKQERPLTERDILGVHAIVMNNIEKESAGCYRTGAVRIAGANFIPPNASKVPDMMSALIESVNINVHGLSDLILATLFHHRFVWIHPFFDGNGRTVRLMMNLLLMRAGYPPAIVLRSDRKKYYEALNQANNGRYEKLTLLLAQAMERSLDIYLSAYPDAVEYKPISELVKEPNIPYGQEYVSLLARRGKIDAYKQGHVWLTTRSALQEYLTTRKRKRKLGDAH